MPGKPFQSCLIPYLQEIATLRSESPPVSYARIADILLEKYGLSIRRAAIAKFVKVRSGGRKAYVYRRQIAARKAALAASAQQSAHTPEKTTIVNPAPGDQEQSKPKFEFKYSERYSLTRLPPEVAAARRKKLEEEGH